MRPSVVWVTKMMKSNALSQQRIREPTAGAWARRGRGPNPSWPCPAPGRRILSRMSVHEVPAPAPQWGQSMHSPELPRPTVLGSSVKRHPGVQPGPTRRPHKTHLILRPGRCNRHRSQSGLPLGLLTWANGEGKAAPCLERPSIARSPSERSATSRAVSPALSRSAERSVPNRYRATRMAAAMRTTRLGRSPIGRVWLVANRSSSSEGTTRRANARG